MFGLAVCDGARGGLGAAAILALPGVGDVFATTLSRVFAGGVHPLGPGAGAHAEAGVVRLIHKRRGQLIRGASVYLGVLGALGEVIGAVWIGENRALAQHDQAARLGGVGELGVGELGVNDRLINGIWRKNQRRVTHRSCRGLPRLFFRLGLRRRQGHQRERDRGRRAW